MPRKPATLNLQCHIHETVGELRAEEIRRTVCVSESDHPLAEFEGKVYCLFHLPTKDKDIEKFEQIFRARLADVEEKLTGIADLPQSERPEDKKFLKYDFSYVWFPSDVDLCEYKFSTFAEFNWATFSGRVLFRYAVFSYTAGFQSAVFWDSANFERVAFQFRADFYRAIFSESASFFRSTFYIATFSHAIFSANVHFTETAFLRAASFGGAKFLTDVTFYRTNFSAEVNFMEAAFEGETKFTQARFTSPDNTYFIKATFSKDTFFDRTRFRNDVRFDQAIFGVDSKTSFNQTFFVKSVGFNHCKIAGTFQFSNLRQGNENQFDFQETVFDKADRVLFDKVCLRPSWFVNVDLEKFIFTAIRWQHIKATKENIQIELSNLLESNISEPARVLEIACRNLAQNTRKQLSYQESTNFLQMADLIKDFRLKYGTDSLTKYKDQIHITSAPRPSLYLGVFIFNNQSYKGIKAFLSTLIIALFRIFLAIIVFIALQNVDFANNLQLKFGLNTLFLIYFSAEIFELILKTRLISFASRLFKNL